MLKVPCCKPTYEGLKSLCRDAAHGVTQRCKPTYEGLKSEDGIERFAPHPRCKPTYEGLKLDYYSLTHSLTHSPVASLPMRD